MIRYLTNKLFGTKSDKILKSFSPLLNKIQGLEQEIRSLSDNQLKNQTKDLQDAYRLYGETDCILARGLAVVKETAKRTLNEKPYDVQILGAIALYKGMITEMSTGEGKTLVSALASYISYIYNQNVHIVTINDYLAKRDALWMKPIYIFHGISVGYLSTDNRIEKKQLYDLDVLYGTNNELGFDYLRDHLKHDFKDFVQLKRQFAIVDEIDSILIDEARTPLIISGPVIQDTTIYNKIQNVVNLLAHEDYEVDEKNKIVILTDVGITKVEKILKLKNIIVDHSSLYDINNTNILHYINQSLKANKIFRLNIDYLIRDNTICIIDEFTGRMVKGRRYSEGLHQAIEAKEGMKIESENQTLASITFQNYFRMYEKLSGMSGTAINESQEFLEVYGLDVVKIPRNIPLKRVDHNDVIYKNNTSKFAVLPSKCIY